MASGARALRKMIAELAEMPAQECAAVLSQLGEVQGERVRALLDDYRGRSPSSQAPSLPIDRRGLPPGLSPWLVELLGDNDATTERGVDKPLTPDTLDTLRTCAAEFTTSPGSAAKRKGIWQTVADRVPLRYRAAGIR